MKQPYYRILIISLTALSVLSASACSSAARNAAEIAVDNSGLEASTEEPSSNTGSTSEEPSAIRDSSEEQPTNADNPSKSTPPSSTDTTAPVIPALPGETGDFGRLLLGEYTAALYYSVDDDEAQQIVDAEDSAVATRRKEYPDSTLVIADHTNQGFRVLYDVTPDETKAFLYRPDGTVTVYLCTKKFNGHNNLSYLTDEDGNDLSFAPVDLVMYTCNETWENVTITYWKITHTLPI